MSQQQTNPPLPGVDSVNAIANLASDAAGQIVAEVIKIPEKVVGLPETIVVGVKIGKSPEIVNLRERFEPWRTAPERIKGAANVSTLASFIDLTERHKNEHSVLFASSRWPNPSLTSVIDYHQTDHVAAFGEHRIKYAFPLTDEFKLWAENNGKPMNQAQFAEFIENNISDLSVAMDDEKDKLEALFRTKFAVPTDLVELSRGLRVHVDERVTNAVMMQSGEAEISFSSEHKDAAGKALFVPGLFMLCLPVFIDGREVRIPARLRYRVKEGALTWSYHLYKWEVALRERVVADFNTAAQRTALPAFEGSPEN